MVAQLFAVVVDCCCNCCIATTKVPWVSIDDPWHTRYLHTSPFPHINCNGLSQSTSVAYKDVGSVARYRNPFLVLVVSRISRLARVQLFLTLHVSKKYDKSPQSGAHALGILVIDKVESGSATFDLAGQKRKVHPRCSHTVK